MRSPFRSASPAGGSATRNLRSISTPGRGLVHRGWNTTRVPPDADRPPAAAGARPRGRARAARASGSRSTSAGRAATTASLLDSFDGRLRAAGLRAEAPVRGATLTLHEPGAPARREKVARAPALPRAGAARGPLRERLAGVLEERALLPAVRVRSTVRPLAVLNGDAKTVVRLELEDAEAVLARGRRVALAPRLTVEPVLGYDAELERTLRVLRDRLGLRAGRAPAVRRGGARRRRAPEGISTKPQGRARARHPHRRGRRRRARAACRDRRDEPAGHDRRPRHRVPARPARLDPARARSVLRELKGVHEPRAARPHVRDELKWAQAADRPGARPRRPAARVGRARRPARARARGRSSSRCATLLARAPRARADQARGAGCASERFAAALRRLARARRAAPAGTTRPDAARPIEERRRPSGSAKVYRRMVRDGGRDRRRQPARGAARAAQARQGAALPARAVRQPVRRRRRQAAGLDAQGPAGGARALPGPRGADRAAARGARRAARPRARGADGARLAARRAGRRPAGRARRVRRDVRRTSPAGQRELVREVRR